MSPWVGGLGRGRWARLRPRLALDGLALRLATLLTVALLPLGLIALDQTRGFSVESSRRAGLSLLSLTRETALPIQQSVERAIGAAEALAVVAGSLEGELDTGGSCQGVLAGFTAPGSPYAFVGVMPRSGVVTCSTRPEPFEAARPDQLAAFLDDPRPRIVANPSGGASGEDLLIVSTPYGTGEGGAQGLVILSVRRGGIPGFAAPPPEGRAPFRLAVLNADGQVLAVEGDPDEMPPAAELLTLARGRPGPEGTEPLVVEGEDGEGAGRVHTVAPLLPGTLYAVGTWAPEEAALWPRLSAPILFPLFMWLASLGVAFWAANRLVVRPVGGIVERMRLFGSDRTLPPDGPPKDAPRELREIDAAFRQTAQAILQDEARMENAFRERGVLLKEVHHRVKNNLQLISSIISMQMRRTPEPRLRSTLRRLQDRVLTLAAIYRTLYTSQDMAETDVAPILRAIVEQEVAAHPGRVALSLRLDPLVLDADRTVSLSFLLAEAVSNAVLQAGLSQGERRVAVTLAEEAGDVRLEVVNPVPASDLGADPGADDGPAARRAGLGAQLIAAFAGQLDGRVEQAAAGGDYRLAVTFPLGAPTPG